MTKENRQEILNHQIKDSSSKLIFGDNILCSQFLRHYADMDILKNIKPEDLEDVSERYVPLFGEERASDSVKKVDISKYFSLEKSENPLGLQLYIVSLIEHKTKVEYNVGMQVLRYTIYIWEDYEKEMERKFPGISERKDFRYPPVIPIVYYEGKNNWTVPDDIADRILCKELLNGYLPHFKYQVVRLQDYSNKELLDQGDEISLAMMINKIRCVEDMEEFTRLPKEQVDEILKDTPDYLLKIMEKVLRALLYSMNLGEEKTENAVSKIKERKMGRLFEGITFDFQAAEKAMAEATKKAEMQAKEAEMRAEMQIKEAEVKKREAEAKEREAEAKEREAEAKEREAEVKKREAEAKEREAEAKEREAEIKIKNTEAEKGVMESELEIVKYIARKMRNGCPELEIEKSLQQEFGLSEEQAAEKLRNL